MLTPRPKYILTWAVPALFVLVATGQAGGAPSQTPADDLSLILISLIIILLAAKLGGDLCERIGQPAVLGELLVGIILGSIYLLGYNGFEHLKHQYALEVLAEIGIIVLLFQIGLESNLTELKQVGWSATLVAILGVVVPFFLGWLVSALFLPDASAYVHIFIGATLCATSIGITARVISDLGKLPRIESKIILGAAVVDDVLGLLILAIVVGLVQVAETGGAGLSALAITWLIAKALIFFVGAIIIGGLVSPRLFHTASRLRGTGILLTVALLFCFILAYLAGKIGLAPIVGAFAAGVIINPVHYQEFASRGERRVEELIRPIATFLVPIFFVRMGLLVDLKAFGQVSILLFALVLTIAAIFGKQVCSLGVLQKGLNRLAIGVGMIPRGEVGLIVAGIGSRIILNGMPLLAGEIFSAVVIMVMITTLITPPVLKIVFARATAEP